MSIVERILADYKTIERRLYVFVMKHSKVVYMEGSNQIVDGGAFSWGELPADDAELQENLRSDYIGLCQSARTTLEAAGSRHLKDFDRSYAAVLDCIRQDSLVWLPSLEEAFQTVKIELDLQQYLIASPHYV